MLPAYCTPPAETPVAHRRLAPVYSLRRGLAERVAVAQAVQRAFLPERAALSVGSLSLRARNELCEDASGDYYDFVPLGDGRIAVAIGDVTGHGLGPALLMAQGRAFLRAFCHTTDSMESVLSHLNDALAVEMTHGRFMSLFFAVVEPETGATSWCNAGHVPALLRRAGTREVEALETTSVVLGVLPGTPFDVRHGVMLEPGDVLFLCSDGATEAASPDGELFGIDRLRRILRDAPTADPDDVLDRVREAITAWTCGSALDDDLTLVAVTRDALDPRR